MRARALLGLALVLALGCGSRKVAPVSGKVTLNGKALAGATVTFQPIATSGIDAGDSSMGKTDAEGKYTLETSKGARGARVGKHRVSISLLETQKGEGHPPRGGWPIKEKIPSEYNGDKTTLSFDVPAGGTDKADFPLKDAAAE
jgi:hypothetical protein